MEGETYDRDGTHRPAQITSMTDIETTTGQGGMGKL